ncbi:MAG: hypothetical protein H6745_03395 [Deltaproteobacteria bacterium]|nr:hypothetical protein [Deltaproteobacteria bacterium]
MDTLPEIDPPETKSAKGWKPFGDAPPRPVVGARTPPVLPRSAPARHFPLWMPPIAGLVVGGLVAVLAAVFGGGPEPAGAPPARGPAPSGETLLADPGATPDDEGLVDDLPGDDELAAAPDAPLAASPEGEGDGSAPAPGAEPDEVVAADAPAPGAADRPTLGARRTPGTRAGYDFDPRKVSDLKRNPYRAFNPVDWSWTGFRRMSDTKGNPYLD